MGAPGEADTVEMAAQPIVGSDQSPRRSSVAAVDIAGLTDMVDEDLIQATLDSAEESKLSAVDWSCKPSKLAATTT